MGMFGARFAVFVRRARVLPTPCHATRSFCSEMLCLYSLFVCMYVYYLLPTTYYLLPTTYYLLPTTKVVY
jgi:hypothetical protein